MLKNTSSDEVLKAFQKVREGRPYISQDVASEVAFMEARGTTNPLKRMTVRELQTLALMAEGKPYGIIAEHLHVSYKTVANTCTQLKAKLGVRTARVDADCHSASAFGDGPTKIAAGLGSMSPLGQKLTSRFAKQ